MTYASHSAQVSAWLLGETTGRGVLVHTLNGLHVPDFSCCHPTLFAPFEERELFATLFAHQHLGDWRLIAQMFKRRRDALAEAPSRKETE